MPQPDEDDAASDETVSNSAASSDSASSSAASSGSASNSPASSDSASSNAASNDSASSDSASNNAASSDSASDDAAIIEGSLHRPERFAAIFDRHAAHIQRYLARRLGQQVADDLVAETFLVAFGKRARYDLARADARPWLYGIATNVARQHQREEIREYRLRTTVGPPPDLDGHADRVAAQVTAAAMHRTLSVALAELAVGDRDVLLLIAWEGLTYDEVAEALGIPVGTVRSRLNRARRLVRAALPATAKETVHHG